MYTSSFFSDSLFNDTKETLEKLSKDYRLGIYSEGVVEFQRRKLALGGIEDFFIESLIFITDSKLEPTFMAQLPEAVIVEDRLPFIEELAKHLRFQPVWVNRDSLSQKTDTFCDTIYTLHELPVLLGVTKKTLGPN